MNIRLAIENDRKDLIEMVNDVYATSEAEFWGEGYYRLDDEDFDNYVQNQWLYIAEDIDQLLGCVLFKPFDSSASSFSMLVCHPDHRKKGIGKTLVNFVTELSKSKGDSSMYLEILEPKDWVHEEKVFLKSWYTGMGYRLKQEVNFRDYYPDHIQFMKCELKFSLFECVY